MDEIEALLQSSRDEVLARFAERVRLPLGAGSMPAAELSDQLPAFLDRLAAMPGSARPSLIAREHGQQRFRLGFSVQEVVREYGILLSCILDVAVDRGTPLSVGAVRALSEAINDASSAAVAEYAAERDLAHQRQGAEHLAFLAHELRNPLGAARVALELLRRAPDRAERAVTGLTRSMQRLTELIDEALLRARLESMVTTRRETVLVSDLFRRIENESQLEAELAGLVTRIDVEEDMVVEGDHRLLRSTLANLVHNVVKFSRPGTTIVLRGRTLPGRRLLEVEDGCGGLDPKQLERMFEPFVQVGGNRSGFGLGLAIARQATLAHGGSLNVRNVPGAGCVFVLDLPTEVEVESAP